MRGCREFSNLPRTTKYLAKSALLSLRPSITMQTPCTSQGDDGGREARYRTGGREKHCETGMRRRDPGGEKRSRSWLSTSFWDPSSTGAGATTLRRGHTCGLDMRGHRDSGGDGSVGLGSVLVELAFGMISFVSSLFLRSI